MAFETFDPVGRRRTNDLGGVRSMLAPRYREASRRRIEGIRQYIRDHREDDFVELCQQTLPMRWEELALSDDHLIQDRAARLASGGTVETVIEKIATAPVSQHAPRERGKTADKR